MVLDYCVRADLPKKIELNGSTAGVSRLPVQCDGTASLPRNARSRSATEDSPIWNTSEQCFLKFLKSRDTIGLVFVEWENRSLSEILVHKSDINPLQTSASLALCRRALR